MKDYAVIDCVEGVYHVVWFDTLREAADARRRIMESHEETGAMAWVAYVPPALLSCGEDLLPITIPGVSL